MRRTGITFITTCLLALVLSCGTIAAAVYHGVVEPVELDTRIGPLHVVTYASHLILCPQSADWSASECMRRQTAAKSELGGYRVWVFIKQPQQRSRVLMRMLLPLRTSS